MTVIFTNPDGFFVRLGPQSAASKFASPEAMRIYIFEQTDMRRCSFKTFFHQTPLDGQP